MNCELSCCPRSWLNSADDADNSDTSACVIIRKSGLYPPLSYPIETVPDITGIPRTKIFEAVRAKELTVRKAGRSTIVEHAELVRYIKALPTKGRKPETVAVSSHAVSE